MSIRWYYNPFYHERTLADDLRDLNRAPDPNPHAHFHAHGGSRHGHVHAHTEGDMHAHSALTTTAAHRRDEAA